MASRFTERKHLKKRKTGEGVKIEKKKKQLKKQEGMQGRRREEKNKNKYCGAPMKNTKYPEINVEMAGPCSMTLGEKDIAQHTHTHKRRTRVTRIRKFVGGKFRQMRISPEKYPIHLVENIKM